MRNQKSHDIATLINILSSTKPGFRTNRSGQIVLASERYKKNLYGSRLASLMNINSEIYELDFFYITK